MNKSKQKRLKKEVIKLSDETKLSLYAYGTLYELQQRKEINNRIKFSFSLKGVEMFQILKSLKYEPTKENLMSTISKIIEYEGNFYKSIEELKSI